MSPIGLLELKLMGVLGQIWRWNGLICPFSRLKLTFNVCDVLLKHIRNFLNLFCEGLSLY